MIRSTTPKPLLQNGNRHRNRHEFDVGHNGQERRQSRVRLLLLAMSGLAVLTMFQTDSVAGRKKGGSNAIHGCFLLRDFVADADHPVGPPIDDGVLSDGLGPYCDGVDFTGVGLGDFFNATVRTKRKGGRRLELDFTDFLLNGLDPNLLPSEEDTNTWVLWIEGTLAQWREEPLDLAVRKKGRLTFGSDKQGWAEVHYGAGGKLGAGDSDSLTVTRIDTDIWTIEFSPNDLADFEGVLGSMPFAIYYDGQH